MQITYDQFASIDIRSGTITRVEEFPEAKMPAYKIWVDFGEGIGIKQTSAQITRNYIKGTLIGKKVAGVINLGTKQIENFMSEFLLLGFEDRNGGIVLITPDKEVPNGRKLH
jgi:tRNA-binding protein